MVGRRLSCSSGLPVAWANPAVQFGTRQLSADGVGAEVVLAVNAVQAAMVAKSVSKRTETTVSLRDRLDSSRIEIAGVL